MVNVAIVGGGPGGYEAALVAAQLGADVTLVERDGLGGSTVLTDCVPSKTLIATAEVMTIVAGSKELGVVVGEHTAPEDAVTVDLGRVNRRVNNLALAQSSDIGGAMERAGVRVVSGRARLDGADTVLIEPASGDTERFAADVVLIATGAHPRVLRGAEPDGERILTWTQVYDLPDLPEHLIVVGSGVTGAEFASAYTALGSPVTLVSSRERLLPGEDTDAADVLEGVFKRRGMTVLGNTRASSVERNGDGVRVHLDGGGVVDGSHCLMAVGSVPNTVDLGLEESGVALGRGDFIAVDRVSRTSARGVYAAGDCTGVLMLASVAAMQGRIAMWHALGEAVSPIDLRSVAANVFTDPEIAAVGWSRSAIDAAGVLAREIKLPLATNARAKMQGLTDGFVKLYCRADSGVVMGGVVVAPRASELIFAITQAVQQRITVDALAQTFSVYPSLSGSIAEAARRLHATNE